MTLLSPVVARHGDLAAALVRAEESASRTWHDERFAMFEARVLRPLQDEDRRFAAALEAAHQTLLLAYQSLTSS